MIPVHARRAVEQLLAACSHSKSEQQTIVRELKRGFVLNEWAMWATLYVDSSNAGGSAWAWGARGRLCRHIAATMKAPETWKASGPSPECHGTPHSGVAELWGCVHALKHLLSVWPHLAGVGLRCDNDQAARAIEGCDGRAASRGVAANLEPARAELRALATKAGLVLRGSHVHGHGRAQHARQRAFNNNADSLARKLALALNSTKST